MALLEPPQIDSASLKKECPQANYTNQRVLVLGLGNAAFETATRASETAAYVHLLGRSRGGLKLASRTHYVGDVRAVNLGSAS